MVNKKMTITVAIVLLANIATLAFIVLFPQFKDPYLFPRFAFDEGAVGRLIGMILLLLAVDALVVVSVWLILKKHIQYILISIVIISLLLPLATAFFLLDAKIASDGFWCSKTNDRACFGVLDPFVDDAFHFETLESDELIGFYKTSEVSDYSYYYFQRNDYYEFDISFSVNLTDERFDEAYSLLSAEPVFIDSGNGAKGKFTLMDDYYMSYFWSELEIDYDNEANVIRYSLEFLRG